MLRDDVSRHSIYSNSAVSNSAMNFLDKNERYSRTYCIYKHIDPAQALSSNDTERKK